MDYLQNNYTISRNLLKNLVALQCETRKFKKVAFALPILDDKAVPNFYHNFVNC